MNKAGLSTVSLLFDIIFPFVLLFGVSLVTKRNSEKTLREFYGCVHTPTVADQAEDRRRVQEAIENPALVEQRKLFPGSEWEFWKPTRADIWGFVGCWAAVGAIILMYLGLVSLGR